MTARWIQHTTLSLTAGLALTAGASAATTYTYQEGVSPTVAYTADSTYIRNDIANAPQDNDPDDENIIGHLDASRELRGLFEFSLDGIAPGSIINSVTLDMVTRANAGGQGSSLTVDLRRYGYDFVESAATWNNPAGDGSDATAGGTLTGPVLSSKNFNPSTTSLGVNFASSGAFANAVAASASDDGVLRLIATGQGTSAYVRFSDETVATTASRPKLTVQAVAPIYEPFQIGGGQYTANTDIRTQNPPNPGFTGAWTGGSSLYQPITGNMTYQSGNGVLVTSGGSAQINIPADSSGREILRPLTDISTPGAFYVSVLMRIDATSNTTTADDLAFVALRPAGNNTNAISWGVFNGNLTLRMRSNTDVDNTLYQLESGYQNDHTYLFVLKIEKNASGFDDLVTVWVDPTNLTAEGANTAALSQYGRPIYDATILNELRVYTDNFQAGEFQFDELRIGSTWASVLPYTVPSPAALPAGLALLAGGLMRRRGA